MTCASAQLPIVTAPSRVLSPTTSIFEPSFLGAVPSVPTTVARHAAPEYRDALSNCLTISFMLHHYRGSTPRLVSLGKELPDNSFYGSGEQRKNAQRLRGCSCGSRIPRLLQILLKSGRELSKHLAGNF